MTSITFYLILIPILAFALLAINFIFAPHTPYMEKNSVFECGFHSFLGQNRTQFSISFFIFALLFLLFDLEILLMYPYGVSASVNSIYGLVVMLIFFTALTLGFVFELGKNALKIESKQYTPNDVSSVEANMLMYSFKHWKSRYLCLSFVLVGLITRYVSGIVKDITYNYISQSPVEMILGLAFITVVFTLSYLTVITYRDPSLWFHKTSNDYILQIYIKVYNCLLFGSILLIYVYFKKIDIQVLELGITALLLDLYTSVRINVDNKSYIELFRESAKQVFNDPKYNPRPPSGPLILGNTDNHERYYNRQAPSADPLDQIEVINETPYSLQEWLRQREDLIVKSQNLRQRAPLKLANLTDNELWRLRATMIMQTAALRQAGQDAVLPSGFKTRSRSGIGEVSIRTVIQHMDRDV